MNNYQYKLHHWQYEHANNEHTLVHIYFENKSYVGQVTNWFNYTAHVNR